MLSASEAAHFGIPVVITPMHDDEYLNGAALVDRGMGVIVRYEDITAEAIVGAIHQVLQPAMKIKAEEVSFSYRNRPQKPIDLAIWWVEYVAALKGSPLTKSNSKNLLGFVYHSLDVYLVLLAVFTGFITFGLLLVKICSGCCTKAKKKED